MKILHWKYTPEVEAIRAFLRWQRGAQEIKLEDHPRVLKESGGKNIPIVYDHHGKEIAKGFQELLKVWDKEGWWLC